MRTLIGSIIIHSLYAVFLANIREVCRFGFRSRNYLQLRDLKFQTVGNSVPATWFLAWNRWFHNMNIKLLYMTCPMIERDTPNQKAANGNRHSNCYGLCGIYRELIRNVRLPPICRFMLHTVGKLNWPQILRKHYLRHIYTHMYACAVQNLYSRYVYDFNAKLILP